MSVRHGETGTRLHNLWICMRGRCNNPHNKSFANYGGRGIYVCEEWQNSYESFRDWALTNGYRDDLTLDRVKNDRGYEPDNCRWITIAEQQNNRRNNRIIEYGGKALTLSEWARFLGMKPHTLHQRFKYGWTVDRALTEPLNAEKARKRA